MDVDHLLEDLIEATDATWHEDVLHIEGPALMDLLRRAQALAVPAGWVLVPVEPTQEMVNAMSRSMFDETSSPHGIQYALWKQVYADLLAAAPQEPRE